MKTVQELIKEQFLSIPNYQPLNGQEQEFLKLLIEHSECIGEVYIQKDYFTDKNQSKE